MAKEPKVGSLVLILGGLYEGETGTIKRLDRRKIAWVEINRGKNSGVKTKVPFFDYKVL